jgi:hypothetical protein
LRERNANETRRQIGESFEAYRRERISTHLGVVTRLLSIDPGEHLIALKRFFLPSQNGN